MNPVLKKMQYKGDDEIIILNSPEEFKNNFKEIESSIKVYTDYKKIKKSDKFGFILIFIKSCADVEKFSVIAKNNLFDDGNLWFSYPKKSSKKYDTDISRDNGWQPLGNAGFEVVRAVAVDEDWSALRFRKPEHIKSFTRDKSWAMSKEGKIKK